MGVCQTARLCFLKRVTIVAGAASPKRPRLRHGLRGLGRHLAATSAPRPHRGTPQRPRAQIQAATEHRLHPARPISAARARLHLRLAPALAAHNLRAGTEPPGACPHDRARNRWHPSLLHLWSPTPHSARPHSGTGQILPRTRGKRNVPQCSPAYHGFPKLGHPLEAANPRPCVLHCAFALGSSCHRQSLSPNLLHLWPQRCGQLLRGPQQDPRTLCLPRCEPGGLQDSSPAVHDAGTDFATPRKHSEARTRNLQRGRGGLESRVKGQGMRV
ncbi:outer dense fiber protein 3B isoform X3 [Chionomys nivalis]|uniref:outer dense fiber protein 3B isoform X3 n=1 Tax=Chionomys nivalis TaxID=269649 RepID=UPI002598A06A|nr:outer dense fiber protein 3B isoform X3 [Chionomys nivalis]